MTKLNFNWILTIKGSILNINDLWNMVTARFWDFVNFRYRSWISDSRTCILYVRSQTQTIQTFLSNRTLIILYILRFPLGPWYESRRGYSEKNGSLKYLVQAWFVVLRGPNMTPHQVFSWSPTFNFIALKKRGVTYMFIHMVDQLLRTTFKESWGYLKVGK